MKHNSAKTEYAQTCIHKLVEAVVELSPDAMAVVFEQESLTYRQVNYPTLKRDGACEIPEKLGSRYAGVIVG